MSIRLSNLARLLQCNSARALADREVTSVAEDSRRVTAGSVFVAVRGEKSDGHEFIADAVKAGAVAVLGERTDLTEIHGVPYVTVENARRALGVLAHALAGDPTRRMTVIGVTGTNGKSSTVAMVRHVLQCAGHPTASLGTLGYDVAGQVQCAPHTTPFGETLAALFRDAFAAGRTHVVMEVSSHALEQERVAGIEFAVAAFTNLTQDHLDYHRNMDEYLRAKLRLFEQLGERGRFTVVNCDDPHAERFIEASRVPCITFGAQGDCRATQVRTSLNGSTFKAATPWGAATVEMALLGHHNVSNAMCAIAITGGLGVPLATIGEAFGTLPNVPGRFERIDGGQPFQVVVDYAHTEDGLRNVLTVARDICRNRVIVVFGCGGDRDRTKRPKMAAVAAKLADFTVLTSDNPRSEDPERILLDIETGMQRAGKKKPEDYLMIPDRAEAIRYALDWAKPGDLVLIAGKGHETYQIFGTERIHFDDREVARAVLEGR